MVSRAIQQEMNRYPRGLKRRDRARFPPDMMSAYSIFDPADPERQIVQQKLLDTGWSEGERAEERAVGCMLGNVIGDALGAPLEFQPVRYGSKLMRDMGQPELWNKSHYNRFRLKPGQWTDDAAMGLCLADSLLVHGAFVGVDLRLRFLNWWMFGYCNAFGADEERGERSSVGLGGNISQAMEEFARARAPRPFTRAGDLRTSGNGSLMRNGACAVFGWNDIAAAEKLAYDQSKTTHQGEEAAEACRLLTHVCVRAITRAGETSAQEVLGELSATFASPLYSVQQLARSAAEERHPTNAGMKLRDRDWNWKDPEFRYSEDRARSQPGYVGSYAMDAIAMALHCVWTTDNFRDAALKAANVCGDADSICAVTCQMAGAIYGARSIPQEWVRMVQQWDNGGDVCLRAYKLFHHRAVVESTPDAEEAAEMQKAFAAAVADESTADDEEDEDDMDSQRTEEIPGRA